MKDCRGCLDVICPGGLPDSVRQYLSLPDVIITVIGHLREGPAGLRKTQMSAIKSFQCKIKSSKMILGQGEGLWGLHLKQSCVCVEIVLSNILA